MNRNQFFKLIGQFSLEKEFIGDGYYRIRQLEENIYELAFLKADSCGGTIPHPQLKIEISGQKLKVLSLIDLGTTPVKNIKVAPGTKLELAVALTALLEKFQLALKRKNSL